MLKDESAFGPLYAPVYMRTLASFSLCCELNIKHFRRVFWLLGDTRELVGGIKVNYMFVIIKEAYAASKQHPS